VRARAFLLAAVSAVAGAGLVGCGSSGDRPTFASDVCPAVVAWQDDVVTSTNAFTDESRHLTTPAQRKASYEDAFGEALARTKQLADQVASAPVPKGADGELVQAQVGQAITNAELEIADGLREARGLGPSSYETVAVHDGSLYITTEKILDLVYHALDDAGSEHHHPDLLGTCGRPKPLGS
jgi:hypothetical protein